VTPNDQPVPFQQLKSFAERPAAHVQHLREFALRREVLSPKPMAPDMRPQTAADQFVCGFSDDRRYSIIA
jgi:hypothetical protein